MVSAAKRYAEHPKNIFGLKCSQHRNYKMLKVLRYYQRRCGARASKHTMLKYMRTLELQVTDEEFDIISKWLLGERPEKILQERLNDARGIDDGSPKPECSVCLEAMRSRKFPKQKLSVACQHEPTVCRSCVTLSIDSQIPDVAWDRVTCPECPEALDFQTVKQWASEESFKT